jgi:hypothetical protein
MFRYRLRPLLILVAVAPVLLAAVWYCGGFGEYFSEFSARHSDTDIRAQLLKHTPPGTRAEDVIKFALNNDPSGEHVSAYWNYFLYERPTRANEFLPYPNQREIKTVISTRSVHFLMAEIVTATWHFDEKDHLTDITIDRATMGP